MACSCSRKWARSTCSRHAVGPRQSSSTGKLGNYMGNYAFLLLLVGRPVALQSRRPTEPRPPSRVPLWKAASLVWSYRTRTACFALDGVGGADSRAEKSLRDAISGVRRELLAFGSFLIAESLANAVAGLICSAIGTASRHRTCTTILQIAPRVCVAAIV